MILDAPARHLLQIAINERRRLGAAVRLDHADDHVDALPLQTVRLLQHLVGLADAGGEAEVDLQPAALLLANQAQEVLRRRAGGVAGHGIPPSSVRGCRVPSRHMCDGGHRAWAPDR